MSRAGLQPIDAAQLPDCQLVPLSAQRIAGAKAAYSTRGVDFECATQLLVGVVTPQAGDLVLARILKIGQHQRIELHDGRRATLYERDEVIVSYAARYAPDQFEGYVPEHLDDCDLVAAGGVAANCVSRHRSMNAPTRLQPLGLLAAATAWVVKYLFDKMVTSIGPHWEAPQILAMLFLVVVAGALGMLRDLSRVYEYLQSYRVAMERIRIHLEPPPATTPRADLPPLKQGPGTIELRHVAYGDSLRDITATAKAGAAGPCDRGT